MSDHSVTCEQRARDMLERMGWERAQTLTAGDVVELANMLAERTRLRMDVDRLQAVVDKLPNGVDTLRTVQTELKPWQERNFPNRPVWMPVMGLAEESGEACHALLKREQGIRCDEDHTANLHDALADIIVYACDVANAEGVDLASVLAATWAKVKQRDWVAHREAAEAAKEK